MKYSAVLLFAVGAFALPQDASITSAPTSALPVPTSLSCIQECDAGDVTCQAACMGNARPNASQAIATNECAAKCDQGDGSTADSNAYAKCVDACINSFFPSSQTAFQGGAGAAAPSSGASASASGTNSANPTATAESTGSASESGSETGSAASPESTGAADKTSARLAGAGLAGLMAIFVL